MTAKPEPCAYCGRPLGPSRLVITSDATGGPVGGFCLSTRCYEYAWESTVGHQICRVARGKAPGGSAGAKIANDAGSANLGLLWP